MSNATELLRRALEKFDAGLDGWSDLIEDIRAYLEAEKEAEPEPVAWMFETARGKHYANTKKGSLQQARLYGNYVPKPLYLHPPRPEPARKPMTEEEMKEAWGQPGILSTAVLIAYTRAVEKYHGIGGSDE